MSLSLFIHAIDSCLGWRRFPSFGLNTGRTSSLAQKRKRLEHIGSLSLLPYQILFLPAAAGTLANTPTAADSALDSPAAAGTLAYAPTAADSALDSPAAAGTLANTPTAALDKLATPVAGVVLDYRAAVRGILNDDQGGPLQPPGLRMAEALGEVRASLQRNLEAKKGGALMTNCSVSLAALTEDSLPSKRLRKKSASRFKM